MPASLHELQTWFLTVMTAAGGAGRGAALAAARHGWRLDDVVAHAHGPAPDTRMHIYADGYMLRLLECLRADYPLLLKVLGDPLFTFFAKAYLWRHPSTSASLYDLGAGFAAFLAESQATNGQDDLTLLLPVELARLERARTEAGRARGLEESRPARPALHPPLALMLGQGATLSAPPCLRLLDLALPLLPFVEQLDADTLPPAPAPQRSCVGVTRMRYRVRAHALADWQYHLLQALAQQDGRGMASQDCVHHAAERSGQSVEHLTLQTMLWLPAAAAAGLVVAQAPD